MSTAPDVDSAEELLERAWRVLGWDDERDAYYLNKYGDPRPYTFHTSKFWNHETLSWVVHT